MNKMKSVLPVYEGQELRDLQCRGHKVPGYKITQDGVVISYRQYKDKGKVLKWTQRSMTADYPCITIVVPEEQVDDKTIDKDSANFRNAAEGSIRRKEYIHILVAETWLDFESQCPEHLEPWWPTLPIELKQELRQYFHIDHIDTNRWNPHMSNLKFVSARSNNANTKKTIAKNSS